MGTTLRRPAEIANNGVVELKRWQKHTTDNVDRLNITGRLRLRKSANQTGLASGTNTPVTFDVHDMDDASHLVHNTVENTTKVTCLKAGIVQVRWTLTYSALAVAGTNRVGGWVSKNGVTGSANSRFANIKVQTNGVRDVVTSTDIITVAKNDYLELYASHTNTTATALDLVGNSADECVFSVEYLTIS
jgi:hypothetical protein